MKDIAGKGILFGIILVLLWQASEVLAQGCAMCGTTVPNNAQAAEAFNWSILFMVIMPYMLFSGIAGWIVYKHRSHKIRG